MKYQGSLTEVKAVEDTLKANTKACAVDRRTGWQEELGIKHPSTFFNVRLILQDSTLPKFNDFYFYISFNYRQRDDYAECWIEDRHVGRMFKVFPDVLPLFGKLKPIILPEKVAQLSQEHYQMREAFNRSQV